jgi:hypothetical protein
MFARSLAVRDLLITTTTGFASCGRIADRFRLAKRCTRPLPSAGFAGLSVRFRGLAIYRGIAFSPTGSFAVARFPVGGNVERLAENFEDGHISIPMTIVFVDQDNNALTVTVTHSPSPARPRLQVASLPQVLDQQLLDIGRERAAPRVRLG